MLRIVIVFGLISILFGGYQTSTAEHHNHDQLSTPIVQTENGRIKGFHIQLDSPNIESIRYHWADIFLGIPFARPPTEELRFENPEKPENWEGVRDAGPEKMAPACVNMKPIGIYPESEDCLYLNVFRPAKSRAEHEQHHQSFFSKATSKIGHLFESIKHTFYSTENENKKKSEEESHLHSKEEPLFPVLVFIHGGGYAVGGSFPEGFQDLSNNFVSQGIVVVTIQYRLGFLGFASDGSEEMPGNLALWDQRQALLWVQRNIKAFGGDPNRVTAWGPSAGAGSVGLLGLLPQAQDLFHQAIEQSGLALSRWSQNDVVIHSSLKFANDLGCSGRRGVELKECLKAVPLDSILDTIKRTPMAADSIEICRWTPRADHGKFFATEDNLVRAISEASPKPTLMSFVSHESLFLGTSFAGSYDYTSPLVLSPEGIDRPTFEHAIRRLLRPRNGVFETTESDSSSASNSESNGDGGNSDSDGNDDQKHRRRWIKQKGRHGLMWVRQRWNGDDNGKTTLDHSDQPHTTHSSPQRHQHHQPLHEEVADTVVQFYGDLSNRGLGINGDEEKVLLERYILFLSDMQFILPTIIEAELKASSGSTVYLLQFDHVSAEIRPQQLFRAVDHVSDYPYTVGTFILGQFQMTEDDKRIRDMLVEAYGAFIRSGNPVSNEQRIGFWPRVGQIPSDSESKSPSESPHEHHQHLSEDEYPEIEALMLKQDALGGVQGLSASVRQRIAFWRQMNQKFGGQRLAHLEGIPEAIGQL